jgi:hypothetical protein
VWKRRKRCSKVTVTDNKFPYVHEGGHKGMEIKTLEFLSWVQSRVPEIWKLRQ